MAPSLKSLILFNASLALALPSNVVRITPESIADITSFQSFANTTTLPQFQVYDDSFLSLIGDAPTLDLIITSSNASFPQFHEAAILTSTSPPVLFVTSNQYTYASLNSPNTSNKTIAISRVTQDSVTKEWTAEIINPAGSPIHLANGGAVLSNGSIILCAQGDLANPGGFLSVSTTAPYTATNILNNYYGTPFNSPNDVMTTKDGAIWFTDPQFGFIQSIRPAPQLPAQIYRFMPGTTDLRVVADGLQAPNGIAFSPDQKTAYITDTANGAAIPALLPAERNIASKTIYTYDVVSDGSGPYLANKRTFAMPSVGIPDGIKTDAAGNVYAGCGDGVNVWDKQGRLLGKIAIQGGAANFALSEKGEVYILNEQKLYLAVLGDGISTMTTIGRRRREVVKEV